MVKTKRNTAYQWFIDSLSSHNSDDCIEYPFTRNAQGYGYIRDPESKKLVKAHRLAFKLTYGHWPTPMGLHRCDCPACFNPRHIFEGTTTDNMADMKAKGRDNYMRGENNGRAKLTFQQACEIRERHIPGSSNYKELAKEYRVSITVVYSILQGRNWRVPC